MSEPGEGLPEEGKIEEVPTGTKVVTDVVPEDKPLDWRDDTKKPQKAWTEGLSGEQPEAASSKEVESRKQEILQVLDDSELRSKVEERGPAKYWLNDLKSDLEPALKRAQQDNSPNAMVLQFADGYLHIEDEARFADDFLRKFGAKVETSRGTIPVNSRTLSSIARDPSLPRVPEEEAMKSESGSQIVVDKDGSQRYLVVDTKIDGVRLLMDGSAVTMPNESFRSLRPMLLIKAK